jgi:hypothetical protein
MDHLALRKGVAARQERVRGTRVDCAGGGELIICKNLDSICRICQRTLESAQTVKSVILRRHAEESLREKRSFALLLRNNLFNPRWRPAAARHSGQGRRPRPGIQKAYPQARAALSWMPAEVYPEPSRRAGMTPGNTLAVSAQVLSAQHSGGLRMTWLAVFHSNAL